MKADDGSVTVKRKEKMLQVGGGRGGGRVMLKHGHARGPLKPVQLCIGKWCIEYYLIAYNTHYWFFKLLSAFALVFFSLVILMFLDGFMSFYAYIIDSTVKNVVFQKHY